jgi:branched-chain amino acid transport system ATP-binding protein
MGNPELILMDEPTEGLAPIVTKAVIDMVNEMQASGCAIILVEHAMDVALDLAGRVYVMSKGEIVFGGTKEQLYADCDVRKKYLEI